MHPTAVVSPDAMIGRDVTIGPFSEIGPKAKIGDGSIVHGGIVEGTVGKNCKVWRMAHVMAGAVVGDDCMLGQNVLVADSAVLLDGVRVQNNTCISRLVTIGERAYVGAGVMFCNSAHPSAVTLDELVPITIGSGASIGSNVCIVGRVTIGEMAVVGAGAVVTSYVAPGVTVVGVPAKAIG